MEEAGWVTLGQSLWAHNIRLGWWASWSILMQPMINTDWFFLKKVPCLAGKMLGRKKNEVLEYWYSSFKQNSRTVDGRHWQLSGNKDGQVIKYSFHDHKCPSHNPLVWCQNASTKPVLHDRPISSLFIMTLMADVLLFVPPPSSLEGFSPLHLQLSQSSFFLKSSNLLLWISLERLLAVWITVSQVQQL